MAKYNNRVDVVIPAFNVPENILFRCLSSIACQTIVNDVDVTIVDDASEEGYNEMYQKLADKFENLLNVKVLRYEENGGPGVARQYGMDNVSNGFIT